MGEGCEVPRLFAETRGFSSFLTSISLGLHLVEDWEGADYGGTEPPIARFVGVATAVRSRFFTMDVARRRDGGWMIVELGDGQVSGLPRETDADRFYSSLSERWPERTHPGS